jgi:hypothetical protein
MMIERSGMSQNKKEEECESLDAWYVKDLRRSLKKPKYTCVKSNYVRLKIRETTWQDSGYIDDLVTLEHFVLERPHSFAEGMLYGKLRNEYSKEWEGIYKELKPKQLESILTREQREKELEERERGEENCV